MMGQDVAIEQTPSRCCAVPTGDDMPEVWTLIHGYDGRRGRALEQSGDGEQIANPTWTGGGPPFTITSRPVCEFALTGGMDDLDA